MEKVVINKPGIEIIGYKLLFNEIQAFHSSPSSVISQVPLYLLKDKSILYITDIEFTDDIKNSDLNIAKANLVLVIMEYIDFMKVDIMFLEIDFSSKPFTSIESFYFYIGRLMGIKKILSDHFQFRDVSKSGLMAGKRLAMIYGVGGI